KARLPVVGLLRRHAVEPDIAAREPLHAGVPDLDAVAFAAHHRPGDVATEEAEARAVARHRDADHRLAIEPADQERAGIDPMEGDPVGVGWIPALVLGPAHDAPDVIRARRRDLETHASSREEHSIPLSSFAALRMTRNS